MTDLGNTFVVEIDANMDLGTVMVLLEAEVRFFQQPTLLHLAVFDLYMSNLIVLNTRQRTKYIL